MNKQEIIIPIRKNFTEQQEESNQQTNTNTSRIARAKKVLASSSEMPANTNRTRKIANIGIKTEIGQMIKEYDNLIMVINLHK